MNKHLITYADKLRIPYKMQIQENQFNIPNTSKQLLQKSLKNCKLVDEISDLANAIAEWSIQVELTEDLLAQCILYGFLDDNDDKELKLEVELNNATQLKNSEECVIGYSKKILYYTVGCFKDHVVDTF